MDEWRVTEEFVLLARNTAGVLARFNPLRLGPGVVPDDEYDVEAGQLARLLLAGQPSAAAEVGPLIDRVFTHYEIAPLAPEAHQELVDAIWREYDALRGGS